MRFSRLSFVCVCGQPATQVQDVGLSAQRELVIRWKCEACKNDIYVVKSLSDCLRECPAPQPDAEELREDRYPSISDAQFLRAMHVKLPDEDEA